MGKVNMLNLFRCSSTENKITEKEIHYFVSDYFDGVKVESLDLEDTSLAECLGIKRKVNRSKQGISHQRYCLYTECDESDSDIFQVDEEFPLLTVIQVFINPDIYQADSFDDNSEITCENCMNRVEECINKLLDKNTEILWKIYRLLTAGDFAVIVRSRNLHDAYDISTLIREISLYADEMDQVKAAFFTYSISGVLDKKNNGQEVYEKINWTEYMGEEDRAVIRICYSHDAGKKRESAENSDEEQRLKEEEQRQAFLAFGQRLLGRYDYQMECTPAEFQELYPYIRDFKFGTSSAVNGDTDLSDKSRAMVWLIKQGYILQINEKLFLKYHKDSLLNSRENIWNVKCKKKWSSLYDRNNKMITAIKKKINAMEDFMEPYYQSASNLNEYVRLMGRLCRILFEINQMQELRISTANLLKQLEVMLESLERYLSVWQGKCCNMKVVIRHVEEYLYRGITALEIFTRYIRNINLQTLQTPNYDLQTNVCVEKVLLAYSEFLHPFMTKRESEQHGGEAAYYLQDTLYPIIVPNMSVRDLSVSVLFDDYHDHGEESDKKTHSDKKLMVVYSPTFAYLCETCFLLPTVFHEIAHQFRYESREDRNACLEAYILKGFILNMVLEIIDKRREYGFIHEKVTEDIVDSIFEILKSKMVWEERDKGLQYFKYIMKDALQSFTAAAQSMKDSPVEAVKTYIEKTKSCVQEYNEEMLQAIANIDKSIDELKGSNADKYLPPDKVQQEKTKYKKNLHAVLQAVQEYERLQKKQIHDEIMKELDNIFKKYDLKELDDCHQMSYTDTGSQKMVIFLCELWNTLEEQILDTDDRNKLKNLIKHFHNVVKSYMECSRILKKGQSSKNRYYQRLFSEMIHTAYGSILTSLENFARERDKKLRWDTIPMESEKLEYLRKKVKIEEENGIKNTILSIFTNYQTDALNDFVDNKIELYREVTSDLFMCSIMGLNMFGYLVVVAENFVFTENNAEALYYRVAIVLQCLSKKRRGDRLIAEEFDQELLEMLRSQVQILLEQSIQMREENEIQDMMQADIDKIIEFLKSMQEEWNDKLPVTGEVSTQKWILRIYLQISRILPNIGGVYMICDGIGEKEIWKDIISEQSYVGRSDMLRKLFKESDGWELGSSIGEILNSPASFFAKKRSLVSTEIKFILKCYEKNCVRIFKSEEEGIGYGNSPV